MTTPRSPLIFSLLAFMVSMIAIWSLARRLRFVFGPGRTHASGGRMVRHASRHHSKEQENSEDDQMHVALKHRGQAGTQGDHTGKQSPPSEDETQKAARLQQKEQLREERRARHRQQAAALASEGEGISIVTLDYPTHEVRLIASSEMEREWRAHSCAKEPWTISWLEESLANGGVLYDIGANVGAFAIVAAKICGTRGTVVAFEPGYASFAHLCDNVVLNRCHDIVIPVPLALSEKTGLGTFTYKTLHPGQSRHDFDGRKWHRASPDHTHRYRQPVLTTTLDEALRNFALPQPNFVKLDVDGAELSVLRGAMATLSAPAFRSLLIEIDDKLTDKAMALLDTLGLTLAQRFKRVHDEKTQVWYGVFRKGS